MATNIPVLPEEILVLIFNDLQDPTTDIENFKTFTALCKVNRQCCRLARPLLYRQPLSPTVNLGNAATKLLVRTLIEKPELAKHIRSLWVEPNGTYDEEEDEKVEGGKHDLRIYEAAAAPLRLLGTGNEIHRHLVLDLRCNVGSPYLVLLLLLAQNLESLQIEVPYQSADLALIYFLETLGDPRILDDAEPEFTEQVLPHLKTLGVSWSDTENTLGLSHVKNFPRIRTLTTFEGHMVDMTAEEMNKFPISYSCNLHELRLTYSLIDAIGLYVFLRFCPQLEVLDIEWGGSTVGVCEICWVGIGEALRLHGHRLKTIKLDPTDAFTYEYNDETSIPPLGDMRALTMLEELAVPAAALVGEDDDLADDYPTFEVPKLVETLPESLQKLEVLRVEENIDELEWQLSEVLMSGNRLSQLCSIRIKQQEQVVFEPSRDEEWRVRHLEECWVAFERVVPSAK